MYIFNILKKIILINDHIDIIKNKILNNFQGSEEIEDTNLEIPTIVDIYNSNIESYDNTKKVINDMKNSINTYNTLISTVYNEENDINYKTVKNIKEIYQFTKLMSYYGQSFKYDNNVINFIDYIDLNDKKKIIFNSMISSVKYTRNQVIIYKTFINDDGVFENRVIPFIEKDGFYHFFINIELEKLNSLESNISKYKIIDKNDYITCIAYQNSIWEDDN